MATLGARSSRTPSNERGGPAGRYPDADAASISDKDEDVDKRENGEYLYADGAGAWRSTVETNRQASRPATKGASHQQPALSGRGISSVKSVAAASRRDSSGSCSHSWGQPPDTGAAAAPRSATAQFSGTNTSYLQYPSTTTSSTHRRHPNGLPTRQTSGPLPGMPYMSELVSRYRVRQAPTTGPQVSLVRDQLYVGDRMLDAITPRKTPPPPPPLTSPSSFPTADMLIPSYVEAPFTASLYMQQRRAEKEQRAVYAAQLQQAPPQQQQTTGPSNRSIWVPVSADAGGAVSRGASPSPAGRTAYAAAGNGPQNAGVTGGEAGATGAGAGASAGGGSKSWSRGGREGVERWLEASNSSGAGSAEPEGGRALWSRLDTFSDPSLVYRQYGIFRTYGRPSPQALWPSVPVSALQQRTAAAAGGGHGGGGGVHRAVASEQQQQQQQQQHPLQKRASSATGGVGPAGSSSARPPSSQPAAVSTWVPPRQSAR